MTATINRRALKAYDPRLLREIVSAGMYDPMGEPLSEAERAESRALLSLAWRERRRAEAHRDAVVTERHSHTCGCPLCL